uniref:Phospho-2-dehydro-3-deoxyheptonate aldolase n=1 Tax=Oryza rufipogon TaxID=4529 RepID=A0A0E0NEJ0_ORYRU
MKTNLERAMKENDRVYLMRVPDASSLGSLPAASLVKPTSLAEVLDASKERLFSSLVPDGSMKALSKYTEMVDNIIRTQAEKLQQASEITRVRLKEMDLPDSILSLEDLKEDVEAVQISGGPAGLEAELQQLRDLSRDDILPKLMAGVGSHDDLFKKEISKYDPVCAEIADNIVAQEQLLLQIQAQNEQFAAVFNLEDYKGWTNVWLDVPLVLLLVVQSALEAWLRAAEFESSPAPLLPVTDVLDSPYMELAHRVDEALGFMSADGLTMDHPIMTTEFWTSHGCLLLPYEQALPENMRVKLPHLIRAVHVDVQIVTWVIDPMHA